MTTNMNDLRTHKIGAVKYQFRKPDIYDPAKARRVLTRRRVRRPHQGEFRVAALAGVAAMAEKVVEAEAGVEQTALMEDWYALIKPTSEDDIDEPDFEKRAVEHARIEEERRTRMVDIYPDVAAIEANLERHWPPYADLIADRAFWDDVSRIEIVRLLLVRSDGQILPLDDEDMLQPEIYQSIPEDHRMSLATFAFGLMGPGEAQRKN